MAVTLADVAKRAGVSPATVSRVLNNKLVMPIPESTIDRIQQAARDLRYRPNAQARALITRRTYTIGFFTLEMGDPHFAQMLQAVEEKARSLCYHIAVCGDLDALMRQGRVDGVLLLTDPQREGIREILEETPAMFVWPADRPVQGCVAWSDNEAAYCCVRYLLKQGHREIRGLFGDLPESASLLPKVMGFDRALQERGLPGSKWLGCRSTDQFENGYLLTQQAIRSGEPFTAIFARNDFLAVGALSALRESGLAVPGDVSVVGYNDTILAHCSALTSMRTPIAEAGAIAVEHLIRSIENEEAPYPGALLEATLVTRQSCARPVPREYRVGVGSPPNHELVGKANPAAIGVGGGS
jgi:LacI family transcriptional regulator